MDRVGTGNAARRRLIRGTRLGVRRAALLRNAFDALVAATERETRLATDPLSLVRRYKDPRDAEVAAVLAASLAFGRVDLFRPVLAGLFERADRAGGPREWVDCFTLDDAAALAPVVYRWNRGRDLALLAATLGAAVHAHGRLGLLFEAPFRRSDATVGPALESGLRRLRHLALEEAPRLGLPADRWTDLPRSFRTFLPLPSEGSACKRWNLVLRWMVRRPGPGADGVDLGLWDLPRSHLLVPLDTHVARIAWFVGLTGRRDGTWRTVLDVTHNLARLDPGDPVRYDFALSHLGISRACRGRRDALVCPRCPLVATCRIGGPG